MKPGIRSQWLDRVIENTNGMSKFEENSAGPFTEEVNLILTYFEPFSIGIFAWTKPLPVITPPDHNHKQIIVLLDL